MISYFISPLIVARCQVLLNSFYLEKGVTLVVKSSAFYYPPLQYVPFVLSLILPPFARASMSSFLIYSAAMIYFPEFPLKALVVFLTRSILVLPAFQLSNFFSLAFSLLYRAGLDFLFQGNCLIDLHILVFYAICFLNEYWRYWNKFQGDVSSVFLTTRGTCLLRTNSWFSLSICLPQGPS